MRRGIFLSALIIAATVITGFSREKTMEKETRNVSGFTRVNFGVAGDLYINIGQDFKVVLEGDKSTLDDIVTEVSGGKLIIKQDSWLKNLDGKVTVFVTMPEIEGIGVSGSGKAEIKDAVKTDNFDLNVSGSGKIFTSDITVSELDASISGSGDIIIGGNGNANMADISISGSGNYAGESLKISSGEFSISGSGSCRCYVTELLKARVSGSGNITYQGDPKIDARISGSGKVRSK